jgi:hypothetical protein
VGARQEKRSRGDGWKLSEVNTRAVSRMCLILAELMMMI